MSPGASGTMPYSLCTCIRWKLFLNILSYAHDITIPPKDLCSRMLFQKRIYTNTNSLQIMKEKLNFNASTQTVHFDSIQVHIVVCLSHTLYLSNSKPKPLFNPLLFPSRIQIETLIYDQKSLMKSLAKRVLQICNDLASNGEIKILAFCLEIPSGT